MRHIEYIDDNGRKQIISLPDDAPDSDAYKGILVGPPDLFELHLPLQIEIRINNQLYDRGLITFEDLKGRHGEIFAALQAALKVDSQKIINAYKQGEK